MNNFYNNLPKREPIYHDVISFPAIYQCAIKCLSDVTWKASVQSYEMDILLWVGRLCKELAEGRYRSFGFTNFYINERGKLRHIQSVHISERTVQKSLSENALKPIIEPLLIDTNTASRKNYGTDQAIRDVVQHLKEHYAQHGLKGGILVMDLHDYFHSIDHEILMAKYAEVLKDPQIYNMTKYFVDCFDEGLGLGSEISQISAIFYPNNIDHYVTDELKLPYARFMDDSYVMCEDIDQLRIIRDTILQMYSDLHITMNTKKTQIIYFQKGSFEYLKKRFRLTDEGEVVVRPVRKVFHKWRRLLKKHKQKLDKGEISMDSIRQSYNSRRGSLAKYNCQRSLWEMDKLYMSLFNEMPNGETIEDIQIRKNLYYYKRLYDKKQMTLDEIGAEYLKWKDRAEWYQDKKRVIKHMNKLVYRLFGRPYNHLKEGDHWNDKFIVKNSYCHAKSNKCNNSAGR